MIAKRKRAQRSRADGSGATVKVVSQDGGADGAAARCGDYKASLNLTMCILCG